MFAFPAARTRAALSVNARSADRHSLTVVHGNLEVPAATRPASHIFLCGEGGGSKQGHR